MKFGLEIKVLVDNTTVSLAEVSRNPELQKKLLAKPQDVEGVVVPTINGKPAMEEHQPDPLLALLEQLMLKVPWILGGDSETVFLKNSQFAFGFEPVSEALQLSFFRGEGNEVEEYLLEPVAVPLENFCEASIQQVRQMIAALDKVDPSFASSVTDVKTLKDATAEGERAFKDYKLQR